MGKKVVILGGGIGGVIAAETIRKKLDAQHEVLLIDKSDKHYYQPAFLGVITNRIKPDSTHKNLSRIRHRGVKFLNEEVKSIDPENKKIQTESDIFSFDYLIVALGAQLAPEKIPGLLESGFTPYQIDSADKLRDQIEKFTGGKIAILICSMPYKCPAAPYETAFLLDDILRKRNIRSDSQISIFTAEGQPMPTAGPALGNSIKQLLEQREIAFNPLLNVKSIDSATHEIIFEGDRKEEYDLLIYIPPHKVPDVIEGSPLAGEMGWIPVEPHSLETKFDGVYAIGDVSAIKLPGSYKPEAPLSLPKAGVFAHEQAKIAAENIVLEIEGKTPSKQFNGEGMCYLETGEGKSAFSKGDFYAIPHPKINFKPPSKFKRMQKILMEKYWLWTKP